MLAIDTDPGIDDALALLLASRSDADISLVTAVGGNVPVDRAARNAAYLVDVLDRDVPVHSGADLDLDRDGPRLHGVDGLGGEARGSDTTVQGRAADALRAAAGDDVDLVALGPVTNLAAAVEQDASVLDRFRSVTIMGGAVWTYGNVTRAAEFNVWADPRAVQQVVDAPGRVRLVPVDVCRDVVLTRDGADGLPAPFDRMVPDYVSFYEERGYPGGVLYDPLALLIALEPGLAETREMDIAVETAGTITRGMTVPEERDGMAEPNVEVVRSVDRERVAGRMQDLLGTGGIRTGNI